LAKKLGTNGKTSEKDSDAKEEMEVSATPTTKSGPKGKAQDLTKSNPKSKSETEKSSKSDRKDESTKQSDKSDENEDKTERIKPKKHITKQTTELRSSTHSTPASASKKRK